MASCYRRKGRFMNFLKINERNVRNCTNSAECCFYYGCDFYRLHLSHQQPVLLSPVHCIRLLVWQLLASRRALEPQFLVQVPLNEHIPWHLDSEHPCQNYHPSGSKNDLSQCQQQVHLLDWAPNEIKLCHQSLLTETSRDDALRTLKLI